MATQPAIASENVAERAYCIEVEKLLGNPLCPYAEALSPHYFACGASGPLQLEELNIGMTIELKVLSKQCFGNFQNCPKYQEKQTANSAAPA